MEDFTKGDHSLKNFIRIMWQNWYIQIWIVFLTGLFCSIVFKEAFGYPDLGHGFSVILFILGSVIIPFKCIQFWNDLKNGRTR